jgi:2-polyprenyl-3-methyl-5-hydroxy-6-metoxy-1,4-benzoquinol methylase
MTGADRRAILAAYPDGGPLRNRVRARRLRRSALRRLIAELPTRGLVVVAGARAANGLAAHAIAQSSSERRVVLIVGPSRRAKAVAASVRALSIEIVPAAPTAARFADVACANVAMPPADAVVLLDALADLDRRAQEALLTRAVSSLRPAGVLVVREIDASARLRGRFARSLDRVRRILDGRRPASGAIRTAGAWARVLEDLGLTDARIIARRSASLDGRCTVVGRVAARVPAPAAPVARTIDVAPSSGPSTGPDSLARACALCGGLRRRVDLRHREGVLVRCRECGFVSVDPLPDRATALAQYDADYFHGERGYRDYAAEEANFRATFRRRLRRLLAFGAKGKLLDVGAATGAFLMEARGHGFDVMGVEPSAAAARSARAAWLDVRTASIETADLPRDRFDVVTCFDVVEHLVDSVGGLRRLRAWARPGGLVAVTVPDYGGHWARLSGKHWPFVTPHEHLHYFTRRTIRAAMHAAGLAVLEVSLATTPVSFGSLALRLPGAMGETAENLLGRVGNLGTALPFGSLLAIARRVDDRDAESAGWEGPSPDGP